MFHVLKLGGNVVFNPPELMQFNVLAHFSLNSTLKDNLFEFFFEM